MNTAMGGRRQRTLSTHVLLLQVLIVVITVAIVGAALYLHTRDTLRDQYGQRALAVGETVAEMPDTVAALERGVPGGELQELVEQIRVDTGMTYIAVADTDGIRFTHPTVSNIGERLSTDPSDALAGETTVTVETGTLGETMRAKLPVYGADGEIIGLVSIGISTDEIGAKVRSTLWRVAGAGAGALAIGITGSWLVARRLRRKTLGLGAADIARLHHEAHEYANRMHTVAGLLELGHVDAAIGYIADEAGLSDPLSESLRGAYADDPGDPTLAALLLSKAAQASERGVELRVARDDGVRAGRLVHGHDALIVVGNLIDNALDAAPSGAGPAIVSIDLRSDDGALIATVSDSGPGVGSADRERIFRLGYSTKADSGRGIGLALVTEAVQRNGGVLDTFDGLNDTGRTGATFRVRLPGMLADDDPTEPAIRPPAAGHDLRAVPP